MYVQIPRVLNVLREPLAFPVPITTLTTQIATNVILTNTPILIIYARVLNITENYILL